MTKKELMEQALKKIRESRERRVKGFVEKPKPGSKPEFELRSDVPVTFDPNFVSALFTCKKCGSYVKKDWRSEHYKRECERVQGNKRLRR